MSFTRRQLDDFIKDNPQHEACLLSFYEEKVKNKTNFIEKKRKLFEKQTSVLTFLKSKRCRRLKCNKPILTSPSFSLRNVKYKVESLDKNNPDYKLLKMSIAVKKWFNNSSDQTSTNIYYTNKNN